VHVALVAHYGTQQCRDVLVGEIEHVTVDEEEDVVAGVFDAHSHRVAFAAIFAKGESRHVEGTGDVDGGVRRSVTDHDDLVDQSVTRQYRKDFGDRLLFVIGGDDCRNPQNSPQTADSLQ